jgi:hypothetical protein
MKKKQAGWLAIVVLLGVGGMAFHFWQEDSPLLPPPPSQPQSVEPPPAAAASVQAEQAIRYPIHGQDAAAEAPLSLDQSDQTLWEALARVLGRQPLKTLFYSDEIVRHIVVTIDNLPRNTAAVRLFPIKPVNGQFLTAGTGDTLAIAPANSARYAPYVRLAEAADAKQLVALYVQFYPLFQRAYQDLGYPKAYFNDRLIAVIDHLLAAPEPGASVALVQPRVVYQYADPELEASSAGHKILVRVGAENAAKIKRKLREIRGELTSHGITR